jgi:hypothetical protein
MVETIITEDTQTNSVKNVLDLKFYEADFSIGNQINTIETFKETISKELTDLAAHADRVLATIRQFATSGDPKFKYRSDISAGLEFYFQFATSAKAQVIKVLDDEVSFCKDRIMEMKAEKDALL